MRTAFVVFALAFASACGGSPVSPSSSSGSTAVGPDSTSRTTSVISGKVVSDPTLEPISGATVEMTGGGAVATGVDGGFSISSGLFSVRVTGKAAGHLDHENVSVGTDPNTKVGLISLAAPFDLTMFRQIVRNAYDNPGTLEPTWRHTVQPRFYLKTTFEDDVTEVQQVELDHIVSVIQSSFRDATGGLYHADFFTYGRERVGIAAGLTIIEMDRNLINPTDNKPVCGLGSLTKIWLQYGNRGNANGGCTCNLGYQVSGYIIIHELSHSVGLWHHGGSGVLNPTNGCGKIATHLGFSEEEKFYAKILYSRPRGNRDPDIDPQNTLQLTTTLSSRDLRMIP